MQKLLEIKNLKVHFPLKKNLFSKNQVVYAVDNVSFDVYAGETIGIVGESGCGKSSLARSLVGLNKITSGEVVFLTNEHLEKASVAKWHKYREDIQFIFQDPVASLNPRMTVAEIIAEPLEIYNPTLTKVEVMNRVVAIMKLVGLSVNQINRYPLEFSGGQCQRIGIARALILKPKLIICDESVSALDASIKAQIINLLKDLQKQLNLTIIFISHDLSVVKHICDRVLVMYLGNIMELSTKNILYTKSHHPYSSALLSAVPIANPDVERKKVIKLLEGELPSSINPPVGCVFNSRCPKADDKCRMSRPPVSVLEDGSLVACFHPD
jgi:oligopeptide transport system ATP-binding protein